MPKPTPSRTYGPLHLEDLDPHRFEDLIRQILYDFRAWRALEATGRSGSDAGFDARGFEIVPDVDVTSEPEDELDTVPQDHDRVWLIQCKREKQIGPTKIEKYLREILGNGKGGVYGLVFAAAADFSLNTRNRFREICREHGLLEAYLWGKGELEDQLYQPRNDHLLFGYFGISLQSQRRKLGSKVRLELAAKRKASRRLQEGADVLIRDASDERYPYLDGDSGIDRLARGHWLIRQFQGCFSEGLRFLTRRHFAYLEEDGVGWDFAEGMNDAIPNPHFNPWAAAEPQLDQDLRWSLMEIWDGFPEHKKAWFELHRIIPYEHVVDIDELGDEYFKEVHLYVSNWDLEHGPYLQDFHTVISTVHFDKRYGKPIPENRLNKFPRKRRNKNT